MSNNCTKLEYIRIQWADIHHCRNQTWQALVIIAGIYAAIGQMTNENKDLIPFIAAAGALISALAANISKQHRSITLQKMSIIKELEEQLALPPFKMRKTLFPVQMIMFLIFAISCAAFTTIFLKTFKLLYWDNNFFGVIFVIIAFIIYYFIPSTKPKLPKNSSDAIPKLPFLVIRKTECESDWKLNLEPKQQNNGRKVCVINIYPSKEIKATSQEWKPEIEGDEAAVIETGYGGIEIGTFTEKANQESHKHIIATEIYTVLEGSMDIRIEDEKKPLNLVAGDEVIIFPNTGHEVLNDNSKFLTRLHSINCYGEQDKYLEVDGKWFPSIEYRDLKQ